MMPPQRFVTAASIRERPLDDEIVLYHPGTDAVSRLDRVGAIAWQALHEPVSVTELAAQVAEQFDVSAAEIDDDIRALLHSLIEAELIEEQ